MHSEFLLYVPKQMIKANGPGFNGPVENAWPHLTVPGDFPTSFENFSLSGQYQINDLTPLDQGRFVATVNLPAVTAQAASLSIDSTMVQQVGNATVRVHVKVSCQDLTFASQKAVELKVSGHLSHSPFSVVIDSLNWPATDGVWSVKAGGCQGPLGTLKYIEKQINRNWAQSTALRDNLMAQLNPLLNHWVQSRRSWTQVLPEFNSVFFLQANDFIDGPSHWIFRLPADLITGVDCASSSQVGGFTSSAGPQVGGFTTSAAVIPAVPADETPVQAQVVLPGGLIPLWGACLSEMGIFNRVDRSQDLPPFQNLMSSLFEKLVIWPDLERFPSTARFIFRTTTTRAMAVAPL
ncbi:MAG: hypothetical protein C5B49_06205, partial [Bdellovibrio sp.]